MDALKNRSPFLYSILLALVLSSLCSIANAEKPGQFVLTFGSESTSMNESIKEFSIATEQSNSTNAPEIEFKITKVNDAKETTYYESNVSSLSDISVDVLPGTYKIYIQNLSDSSIQEYNNDSDGYMIGSGEIIPLEYKHAAGYILDAPWRIEYSKNNISLLAIDYDLLAPDIKNISIYDANANDTFVQSTNWDVLQSISISSMPYFFHLTVDKNKFIIDSQNRIAVKIRFDLTGIYDDIQGPIYIYRAEKDLPKVRNWFYGDTHVHSNYTSNAWEFGAPVYATSKAIDAIGLNWVTITDHSFDQTNLSTKWNDYLHDCDSDERCLRAEEVSCDWGFLNRYGHYLSYGNSNFIVGHEVYLGETKTCDEIVNLINTIGFGYVAHPMHSDIFRNFWQNFSLPVTGLEVWNGVGEPWETERDSALIKWVEQLALGRHIFISAGSDAHGDFNSALGKVRTACFAQNFTKDNIFSALRNGNCMMTDGPLITFTANNHIIGESFNVSRGDTVALNISWNSTNEFGNVTEIFLIRGKIQGTEINETIISPNNLSGTITLTSTPHNTYYRIEARSNDSEGKIRRAYTNPIWVYAEPLPEVEKIPMDEIEHARITAFEEKYDYSMKDLYFDGWPVETDCQTETLRENLRLDSPWQVIMCEKMILSGSRLMWAGFNNTNTGEYMIMLQIGGLLRFANATYHKAPYDPRYSGAYQGYRNDNWVANKAGKEIFEINWIANTNPYGSWYFGTYLIHGFRKQDGSTSIFYSHWGPEQIYSNTISSHKVNLNFDNDRIFALAYEGFVNSFTSGRFNRGILQNKSFGYESSVFRLGSGSSFDTYNRTIFLLEQTDSAIRCHANIDCNDNNLLTTDTCIDKGTSDSRCEHTPQELKETKKPFTEMDGDEVSKAIDFRNRHNKTLGELYFDGWANTSCNNNGVLDTLRLDKNWSVFQCEKFTINNTKVMFAGLSNTLTGKQYAAYQIGIVLIDENATYKTISEPDYVYSYYINSWTAVSNGRVRFEINTFKARYCNPDFYNRWCSDKDATYIIHGFLTDGNRNTNMLYSFKNFPYTISSPPFIRVLFDNYMNFNLESEISESNSEAGAVYKAKAFNYHALSGWTFGGKYFNYQANNKSLFHPYRANDLLVELGSPAHILVNDSFGRLAGYFNGSYINEIPGAEILSTEPHERYILPAGAQYRIIVQGYQTGNYSLKLTFSNESGALYFRNISASNETNDVFELNGAEVSINTSDPEKAISLGVETAEGNFSEINFTITPTASASINPDWTNTSNISVIFIESINHPPKIISAYPLNNSAFGQWEEIPISIKAIDEDNDVLMYSIYFDERKISDSENTTYLLNESGTHTIRHIVSDGANSTIQEISVSVVAHPKVTITSPSNITYNSKNISVSAFFDGFAHTTWLSVDGSSGQNYMNGVSGIEVNLSGLPEGAHTVRVYANNSIGVINSSDAYFTIDTRSPEITIQSPNNQTYGSRWIWANISLDEAATFCVVSLNETVNITMSNDTQTSWSTNISFGLDGPGSAKFYCGDAVGNTGTSPTIYFSSDATPPRITIVYPENGARLPQKTKSVRVKAKTDENSSCKYSTIDPNFNYSTGMPFSTTDGKDHSFLYSGLSKKRAYTLYYKCMDSHGNINPEAVRYTFTIGKPKSWKNFWGFLDWIRNHEDE